MQTGLGKARSWLRQAIGAAKPELRLEAGTSGIMGVSVKFPSVRTEKDLSRLAAEVFALPQQLYELRKRKMVIAWMSSRRFAASTAAAWSMPSARPFSISGTSGTCSPDRSRASWSGCLARSARSTKRAP